MRSAATVSRPPEALGADIVGHGLVADLHAASRDVFWADLLGSAAVGWTSFGLAWLAAPGSLARWGFAGLAALALYRALCFTHEITHLRRGAVPGFETAWNLIVGVPLLLPSFTYVGVHQSHHHLATYGTWDDPEYLPFARSRRLIVAFSLQASLVAPFVLLVRFLILGPMGLVWPRFHRWLEAHASSFAMNPRYRRQTSAAAARQMRLWEAVIVGAWGAALAATMAGLVSADWLPLWVLTMVVISVLNMLRVLGAHEYESNGTPRGREGQFKDSIDTPGGPWTELWAPVGLRYHALHHYFPGIPYHNLPAAYRRIVASAPSAAPYLESTSPSLRRSLNELYRKARAHAGVDAW